MVRLSGASKVVVTSWMSLISSSVATAQTLTPAKLCTAGGSCGLKDGNAYASEGFTTFASKVFNTDDFLPRWQCGHWPSDIGWLHILSDLAIFGAYFAIPVVLLYFIKQRNDLPFPRVVYLFAAFIMACGIGHLMEAVIFWWPAYRLAGLIKMGTAIVSCVTVLALIRLLPGALRLPSAAMLGEKLLESQERLAFALGSAKIGVWHLDVISQSLTCDERACEIFHANADERQFSLSVLLGRIVPEDRARVSEAIAESAKGIGPLNEIFRLLGEDDAIHHVQVQGKFSFDKRGVRMQLAGVCQDITDKQLKDDALHESEQKYRSSFENIPVGIAHVSNDGNWLKVNQGLCNILGYTSKDLLSSGFPDVIHSQDLAEHFKYMQQLLDSEIESYAVENRFRCKDGSYLWVSVTVTLIRKDSGKPPYFIFVIDDIDDRKKSESALKDYHSRVEKLSLVASKTQHSIIVCDANANIEWANEAFMILTGYSLHSVEGEHICNLLNEEKIDVEILDQIRVSLEQQESIATEVVCCAKDGRSYWVELKIDPVFDCDGNLTNFIATQNDITERKRSEERLASAKQAAEDANQAKSEFLASMSHELRTPLHGVIGMTELLADSELDSRQQRFVKACQTSGHTLLTIINDILDFSKIEAGKLELDSHPFNLLQLLDEIVETVGLRIQNKDVELVYRVNHSNTLILQGDSNRLRQVLINLVGNAIKFTQKGKIELLADPIEVSGETAIVRFSVKDSGIGIPQSQLSKLFVDFSQVHDSSYGEFGGTGLGLSISKSIVEAMGGEIGVNSIENVGSEFWFTITLGVNPNAPEEDEPLSCKLPRLRVLIVDNINPCSDMLKKFLASWRMQTDLVGDVDDAYFYLEQAIGLDEYDLVIVHRSVIGAFDLAERIRNDKSLKETQIFLVTALDDEETSSELFNKVIHRPIGQSNLFNAINSAFCSQVESSIANACTKDDRSLSSPEVIDILIAEDNETNQLFVREVVNRIGWKCRLVRTGIEALAAIESHDYDVALMDCHMPEMDGFAAAQEIRNREAEQKNGKHLPIVALTANAIKGDCEKCLAAGMDAYLAKPFKPYELKLAIEKVLNPRESCCPESSEEVEQNIADNQLQHVFREDELLKHCMGNRAFAGTLLQTFVGNCRKRVNEIVNHVANDDYAAAGESAHGLKGISGIVGARSLQTIASEVETEAEQGNLQAIRARIDQLVSLSEECIRNCLDVSELYTKESSAI